MLGWGEDYFGIWERTAPDEPVARFPRSDAGWQEAWNDFNRRERRYVAVQPGGVTSQAGAASFRSTAKLAKVVVAMVGAVALLAVLTIAARAGLIARLHGFQRGEATRAAVVEAGDAVDGLAVATFLATLVTAVVWIVWQHHAHKNLPALGVTGMRFTTDMVVLWWIIPVANFVMPLLTMTELWKASDPEARTSDWRSKPTPGLLITWWVALVARVPLGWAVALVQRQAQTAERLLTRAYIGLAVDATIVISAMLAIAVVRAIQTRQDRSAATLLTAAEPSTA